MKPMPKRLADGKGPPEPTTPEEWQVAMDGATALLIVAEAAKLGYISGGPNVNVERCRTMIERGTALGHAPEREGVLSTLAGFAGDPTVFEVMLKVEEQLGAIRSFPVIRRAH